MSEQKRRCWAECLGDCNGPLSLEHVASACIFQGDSYTSHGMYWSRKKGFTQKVSRMGAHILCKHHNESTSDLDNCAGRLSAAVREFWSSRRDVVLTLKGEEFERWSCKLLTNMLASGWFTKVKAMPPQFLVEHVFGRRKMGCRAGLHAIMDINHSCTPNNFQFRVLEDRSKATPGKLAIRGFVFNFQSLVFAFFPKCGEQKEFINSLGNEDGFKLENARLHRHPRQVELQRSNKKRPFTPPQRFKLKLDWDTEPSTDSPDESCTDPETP